MITILCRQPGFRRAGIAHPAEAEYAADRFTAEALALLRAEPLLTVIGEAAPALGTEPPVTPDAAAGAAPAADKVARKGKAA